MADGVIRTTDRKALLVDVWRRAGMKGGDSLEAFAEKFLEYFPPTYTVVEKNSDRCILAITTCPDSSLLSCFISGDANYPAYAKDNPKGMEHSLIRIGNNALVVADFFPGDGLYSIEEVTFLRPVPLGTEVHISLTKQGLSENSRFTVSLMEGWLAGSSKPLFKPSQILTYQK